MYSMPYSPFHMEADLTGVVHNTMQEIHILYQMVRAGSGMKASEKASEA